MVTRLRVGRRALEYGVASAVLGAVSWLLLRNGVLGRLEGLLLVLLYVGGVVWVWRREQAPPLIGEMAELEEKGHEPDGEQGTGRALFLVLAGLVGMVVGGALAVRGAEGLVDVMHAGESVIGLTVLALATSAEMVALVWAARRRRPQPSSSSRARSARWPTTPRSRSGWRRWSARSGWAPQRHHHRRGVHRGAAAGAADRAAIAGCCPGRWGRRWSWAYVAAVGLVLAG